MRHAMALLVYYFFFVCIWKHLARICEELMHLSMLLTVKWHLLTTLNTLTALG